MTTTTATTPTITGPPSRVADLGTIAGFLARAVSRRETAARDAAVELVRWAEDDPELLARARALAAADDDDDEVSITARLLGRAVEIASASRLPCTSAPRHRR